MKQVLWSSSFSKNLKMFYAFLKLDLSDNDVTLVHSIAQEIAYLLHVLPHHIQSKKISSHELLEKVKQK